ncbi:MAG: uracil-DNA glycosylase [Chloroflexia bacterium]|nr:uracil-DNA glycosylase [Chloroflexia bacterium]
MADPSSVSNIPHRKDSLALIAREVRTCQLCPLSKTRTHAVPGEGDPDAPLMLIGEGPGYNEDKLGRPFVGAAGKFLEELLATAELKREDVFITNVVKCRPPQNRDPMPEEIRACSGYLARQIRLIEPSVVATLGRHSMASYFPAERISRIHGQPRNVDGLTVVPLFHPAAALHQPALKTAELEDFARLPEILRQSASKALPAASEPEQAVTQSQHKAPTHNEGAQSSHEQLRLFE